MPILPQEVKLLNILDENPTDIDVSGRGKAPEEVDDNEIVAKGGDLSRQEGGTKRGGLESPAAMSTPVKPQPPKRNRRNDTAADDETASVSRSLFSGAQTQTQESTQESARHLPSALQHGTSKLPSPSVRSPTDLECAAVQRGRPSGTPGHPDVQVDQTEIKSEMKLALGNKLLTVLTLINNIQF